MRLFSDKPSVLSQMPERLFFGFLVLALAACSTSNFDELDQSSIGYIGDYSKFKRIETNDGLKSFRYVSDKLRSGIYTQMLIEPVDFYPGEVTSDQITMEFLDEVKAYVDSRFRDAVESHFPLVSEPAANTLVLTPRITAVKTTTGDVEVMEMVPVGSLIALGKAAAGYRHQNVELFMEIKATDGADGSFVGGSVKQGKGVELPDADTPVTLENVKPLIEVWIRDTNDAFANLKALQTPVVE